MIIFSLSKHKTISRLEIQAKVRQLGRNPSVAARQSIETAREQLSVLLQELKNAINVAGVVELNGTTSPVHEPLAMWDDILYEAAPADPNPMPVVVESSARPSTGPIQLEDQLIRLPSNGNIEAAHAQLEITHRISHADHHLNRIRDLIAEKSFQYSHVIRVSPRKGVNTRSRAEVKKLNLQISVHCRLYTQCRAKLIKLGADTATINRFRILTIDDVKASTAVVNPNEPGSTRLKLSWIWQSAGGHRWGWTSVSDDAGTTASADAEVNVFECKFFLYNVQVISHYMLITLTL
jgi:hypothetical protein